MPVEHLRAPFPYFGGKSRVAHLVWQRFGDVPNYVEPFAGSLAVLLSRPHAPRIETVNDLDCYIANFWRALQAEPDMVAEYADWPVNEADLHARHQWLVNRAEFRARMHSDPDYYDVKIAGWWVWGICQWIGSGWCETLSQQRPHLGDAGRGIHRPSHKLPNLGNAGIGINAARGLDLYGYFAALQNRLRRVRVCCGDWSRVLGDSPTTKLGLTAIFLDPPYSHDIRDSELYAHETDCSDAVREWAIASGDNPMLRIALCGYEGEHAMPDSWECVEWKANGGYAHQGNGDNLNAHKERLWFSPYCLRVDGLKQGTML